METNADKAYYGSRQRSVINNAAATSRRGRPGDPIAVAPMPPNVSGDTDTDKYYANGGSRMQRREAGPVKLVPVDRDSVARPMAGGEYRRGDPVTDGVVRPLAVLERGDVRRVVDTVVGLLTVGQPAVIVQAATAELATDMSLQLDLAVARERITHDRRRDVRVGLIPRTAAELAEQAAGRLDPAAVPAHVEEEPLPDNLATLVKGGDDVTAADAEILDPNADYGDDDA